MTFVIDGHLHRAALARVHSVIFGTLLREKRILVADAGTHATQRLLAHHSLQTSATMHRWDVVVLALPEVVGGETGKEEEEEENSLKNARPFAKGVDHLAMTTGHEILLGTIANSIAEMNTDRCRGRSPKDWNANRNRIDSGENHFHREMNLDVQAHHQHVRLLQA